MFDKLLDVAYKLELCINDNELIFELVNPNDVATALDNVVAKVFVVFKEEFRKDK
jgi:hypothetical protein